MIKYIKFLMNYLYSKNELHMTFKEYKEYINFYLNCLEIK